MKLAIQLNDVELIKDIFVSYTGRYGTMIQSSVTVYITVVCPSLK